MFFYTSCSVSTRVAFIVNQHPTPFNQTPFEIENFKQLNTFTDSAHDIT